MTIFFVNNGIHNRDNIALVYNSPTLRARHARPDFLNSIFEIRRYFKAIEIQVTISIPFSIQNGIVVLWYVHMSTSMPKLFELKLIRKLSHFDGS